MDEKVLFQEFFEPLLGIPNLSLNPHSLSLARMVYLQATREINKSLKNSHPSPKSKSEPAPENLKDVLELGKKCDDLKSNLKTVMDVFEMVEKSRTEFLNHFSEFKSMRLELIAQFQDMTSMVDYKVYRWNVGHIISRTLMIAGGVAVFGPILSPLASAAVLPLAAGGLSGAAAIFAWRELTRHGMVENQTFKDARDLRLQDLRNLERLEGWFESSEELVRMLSDVIGGNTLDVMVRGWKNFLRQLQNMGNGVWVAPLLKQWVRDAYSCWFLQPRYGPDFAPVVLTFAFVVLLLQERNVLLLECVARTRRIVPQRIRGTGGPPDDPNKSDQADEETEKGGKILCEDLEESDLVGLSQSLKEETGYLQTIYCVLVRSLEDESSSVNAFSNEDSPPTVPFEELEKRSVIIVFNVPCSAKEDEVITLIEALLPPNAQETVKFLKIMPGLLGDNWVLEINKTHLPMLLKRKITVSDQVCTIDIYFGIFRCNKCQRFGHNVMNCEFEIACAECSENHSVKSCTVKVKRCINCIRFNKGNYMDFNVKHPVDGRKCQTYHNLKEHLRNGKSFNSWIKMAG